MLLSRWLRVCLVLLVVASTLPIRFVSDTNALAAVVSEGSEESTVAESDADSNLEIFEGLLGQEHEVVSTAMIRIRSEIAPLPRFAPGDDLSARGPPSA